MRVSDSICCESPSCEGVRSDRRVVPDIEILPGAVSVILISEAAPENPGDFYYAEGDPLFARTTVQAFRDAGEEVSSIRDILGLGVYLTSAVKCGKTGYGIAGRVIDTCSRLLERELALFPDAKALLLMGDAAIRAVNAIAKRAGEPRVIPAGSTYKLRGNEYFFRGMWAFPSYLQAGPAFFIEKSKRQMIAEDIKEALRLARG